MHNHRPLGPLLRQLHQHFPIFLARRTLEQGGSTRRWYAALLGMRSSPVCFSLYLCVADVDGVLLGFLVLLLLFPMLAFAVRFHIGGWRSFPQAGIPGQSGSFCSRSPILRLVGFPPSLSSAHAGNPSAREIWIGLTREPLMHHTSGHRSVPVH